ncbi:MAG: RecQ family ATP-dependent DNA helicase [Bacteroidaceae bacterium]|nr:RecQ family ATP-dependent DNA helicase [Bacteroidaceae bacterium]
MEYQRVLREHFGYDTFRSIQEDIIRSIGSGRDTLGLMPTGGGKSITFQVPALAMPGTCIVITPLIALMKDQVVKLRERGIKATAIYSGMSRDSIVAALDNCILGGYKFLYISPERLSSDIFLTKLRRMQVSFITIDESHCISQWGYDFRPSYLAIADIRKQLPDIPILALTATATPEVVKDIQQRLQFRKENVFRMSFERKNLNYIVRHTENKEAEMLHILSSVQGSAIVYVRNRDKTREIARLLNDHGISAAFYHAGIDSRDKDKRQQQWTMGATRVMVATNAFGMGIDKPDVRMVIHYEMPDSPEAYYQEAGRAGRDGLTAYAVLLYTPDDKRKLSRRVSDNYPDKEFIRGIYERLGYYYQMAVGDGEGCHYDFDLHEFCRAYHLPLVQTESALRLLTQAGYIHYEEEEEHTSRLRFTVQRDELYRRRDDSDNTDTLIRTLLRHYSGVFSDYVFIDEKFISEMSGIDLEPLYEALLGLGRARVIHYIPRRTCPSVTFTRKRVDTDRVVITPAIYEERKKSYAQRIEAMKEYTLSENQCRSRMLLRYFGEHAAPLCQVCDNCRKHRHIPLSELHYHAYREMLFHLLSDGEPHSVEELRTLPIDDTQLKPFLQHLIEEEAIVLQDGMVKKRTQKEENP